MGSRRQGRRRALLLQFQALPAHLGGKAETPRATTDGDRVGAERKKDRKSARKTSRRDHPTPRDTAAQLTH